MMVKLTLDNNITIMQLLRQIPFAKKLQTQTVSTEKLCKILACKKNCSKNVVKLTAEVNFIYIL